MMSSNQLTPQQSAFVIEYVKDFNARRAAEAAGFAGAEGVNLMRDVAVNAVVHEVISDGLVQAQIDSTWLLWEMIDNHRLARQCGNLAASNVALGMIAKHKMVDAFAADKIKVSTDADVSARLASARSRLTIDHAPDQPEMDISGVSFI